MYWFIAPFHGGWCWHKVLPLLGQAGHTAIAADLPSHGEDAAPVGQQTLRPAKRDEAREYGRNVRPSRARERTGPGCTASPPICASMR